MAHDEYDEYDDARPVNDLCPECGGVTVAQHEELGRLRRGREISPPQCTTPELHRQR